MNKNCMNKSNVSWYIGIKSPGTVFIYQGVLSDIIKKVGPFNSKKEAIENTRSDEFHNIVDKIKAKYNYKEMRMFAKGYV